MIPTAGGPVDGAPPDRPRWWAPATVAEPGAPISTARAYVEALGVYAVFFAPSVVAAAGSLAGVSADQSQRWWISAPTGIQQVLQAVLAVVVVVVLAERRGLGPRHIGLAARRASGGPGSSRNVRMAAWAVAAFVVGGAVTSALATGHFPLPRVDGSDTFLDVSLAVQSGIVEEVVVLAFLVTTLEQARRPRLEIAAVAVLCRMAYHIYYGPGVAGILVWAIVFLWLFWRFRSVVALIVTHVCWDALIFLSRVSSGFAAIDELAIVGLVVTGPILWLVERADSRRAATPPGPDPGGHWPGGAWNGDPVVPDWGPPAGSP